jgi:hypothetical protein
MLPQEIPLPPQFVSSIGHDCPPGLIRPP